MKIGIAGVGGIGSNVAVHLVRSGIRQLKLVDFDRVEHSNLNRQFYFADQVGSPKCRMLAANLRRIAPDLELECLQLELDAGNAARVFEDCGIVVEGLDLCDAKKMLWEAATAPGRPVISASGVAGRAMDDIRVRPLGHGFVVGDFATDADDGELYSPKIAAIAAMMADLVLRKAEEHDPNPI